MFLVRIRKQILVVSVLIFSNLCAMFDKTAKILDPVKVTIGDSNTEQILEKGVLSEVDLMPVIEEAIEMHDRKKLEVLLQQKLSDYAQLRILEVSIAKEYSDGVALLLDKEVTSFTRGQALLAAVRKGSSAIVKIFLKDEDFFQAILSHVFQLAAALGHNAVVYTILEGTYIPPITKLQGLYVALDNKHENVVNTILASGVSEVAKKVVIKSYSDSIEKLRALVHESYHASEFLDISGSDIKDVAENVLVHLSVERPLAKVSFQDITILNLAKSRLTSKAFNNFTAAMLPAESFPSLCLLNLSENRLDEEAASTLLTWLRLPDIEFVNVAGNPISLIKIELLYNALEKIVQEEGKKMLSDDEKQQYVRESLDKIMKKIIFMSAGYVSQAKEHAGYKILVEKGIIPRNWAKIHENFYTSPLWEKFLRYEYIRRYNEFITYMNELEPSKKDSSVTIESEESTEESSEEGDMTFLEAWDKLIPHLPTVQS